MSTAVIKVPVFLMEGKYDHECPSEIADRYFNKLRAPAKELIWFNQSAHVPNAEERDLFNKIMVEEVLPIAARQLIGHVFVPESVITIRSQRMTKVSFGSWEEGQFDEPGHGRGPRRPR